MSLRLRLTLVSLALALVTVGGFGAFAYTMFVRQQDSQMRSLLAGELERVSTLLARPRLGASLRSAGDGTILQFVTGDGRVVESLGAEDPLPLVDRPTLMAIGGRPYLAGSAPWPGSDGTLRMALDASGATASRARLAGSLLVSGAVTALLATLFGLLATRGALAPLERVARATRAVDARAPNEVPYTGPHDEVFALVAALNDALSRIRSRGEEERTFLVEVAHELAGPLTLVSYHLDAVRRELPEHAQLRAAADAAHELLRTSQDLLALARGELERPLEMRVCDLAEAVRRVCAEYPGVEAQVRGVTEVVGDPERLMQVVRNLVRNGAQAAGTPRGVRLALDGGADEVVLRVEDDGPGMSRETVDAVTRGVRVPARPAGTREARAPAAGGTAAGVLGGPGGPGRVGVGLGIAQRIVSQHGGSVEAVARPGTGTVLTLRLPSLASRLERADEAHGTPGGEA